MTTFEVELIISYYSKTPIYRVIWGKGKFAVNRVRGKSGLCLLVFTYKSLKRGKEIDRGKSRFALYRSAVNRGFTVLT